MEVNSPARNLTTGYATDRQGELIEIGCDCYILSRHGEVIDSLEVGDDKIAPVNGDVS